MISAPVPDRAGVQPLPRQALRLLARDARRGYRERAACKYVGHDHIPQRFADDVSRVARGILSPFLNFHRPCLFATEHRDANGRIWRKYLALDVMTPYTRL